MSKPLGVHRSNWQLQDSSGPILLDNIALDNQGFEPLLNQPPDIAPGSLFGEDEEDDDEATGDL